MGNLLAVVILLALLCVSTVVWARSQTRGIGAGRLEDDVVRARLWAAGVSLALLILAVAATGMALFAPGGTGLERIVRALGSGPVLAGLVLCAATGGYVACLCAGLWRSQDGRLVERLHLSLHMAGFYAVILLMLSIGSRVW